MPTPGVAAGMVFGTALAVFLIAFGLAERDGTVVLLGLIASLAALMVTAGLVLGGYWLAGELVGPLWPRGARAR